MASKKEKEEFEALKKNFNDLLDENKTLWEKIEELQAGTPPQELNLNEDEVNSLKDEVKDLKAKLSEASKSVKSSDTEEVKHNTVQKDCVYLDGKCYDHVLVETVAEVNRAMQRSELTEDQTCVVISRIGA